MFLLCCRPRMGNVVPVPSKRPGVLEPVIVHDQKSQERREREHRHFVDYLEREQVLQHALKKLGEEQDRADLNERLLRESQARLIEQDDAMHRMQREHQARLQALEDEGTRDQLAAKDSAERLKNELELVKNARDSAVELLRVTSEELARETNKALEWERRHQALETKLKAIQDYQVLITTLTDESSANDLGTNDVDKSNGATDDPQPLDALDYQFVPLPSGSADNL